MAFEEMSRSTGQRGASSHLQPGAAHGQMQPCCAAKEPRGQHAHLGRAAPRWLAPGGSEQGGDHGMGGRAIDS